MDILVSNILDDNVNFVSNGKLVCVILFMAYG